MNKRCLLVDTCNLLHRIPRFKDHMPAGIDLAAERLLAELRPLHDLEHWEIHLVVDGKGSRLEQQFMDKLRTLSLSYAPAHMTADTVIESWLLRLGPDWQVRVASEDLSIFRSAVAAKAEPLSANELFQWLDRVLARFRGRQPLDNLQGDASFGNKLEGLS